MKKKKITNIQLAHESGLSLNQVSRILTGTSGTSKKTAIIISEAASRLGVDISSVDVMFNYHHVRRVLRGEK